MEYNPQKQNRKSIRLKEYDYSFPGWYYVTICTKNFKCWFGKVKNGNVLYNNLGIIAQKYFGEIPEHFKNTEIDDFIIMPSHAHGIIIINDDVWIRNIKDSVGTRDRVSLRRVGNIGKNSLSLIINQYKGSVPRFAHKSNFNDFHWQTKFYEHIIRNDNDLHRIRTYIRNNPLKWDLDEYYNS